MLTERGYIKRAVISKRLSRIIDILKTTENSFDTALIIDRVNQYYFTGTMQDAVLIIRKDGFVGYFVRKSYERAKNESAIENIYPIKSYKDILDYIPSDLGNVYLETSVVPLVILQRLEKVFEIKNIFPIERAVMNLRMIKEKDELDIIRESGRLHSDLLKKQVPELLSPGISEVELMADIHSVMLKSGYHGFSRFGMFQMEMLAGQIGFGENSLYPTSFNGPGGMLGMSPAVPGVGNHKRKLKKGDLVFVDIGFGVDGYHSDKTQIYSLGESPSEIVLTRHSDCLAVLEYAVSMLKPGQKPSEIYNQVKKHLPESLKENFMGYGSGQVNFLGHGVGLQIDEFPVIAAGFDDPLVENMVIALEPKSGIEGFGMVGAEETYIITSEGADCITGGAGDIIVV